MAPHVVAGHKINDCANVMYTGINGGSTRVYAFTHTLCSKITLENILF